VGRSEVRLRTILIASGIAVALLTAGAFAFQGNGSAESGQAAHTAPQARTPQADPPRTAPSRASRGGTRSAEPDPTKNAEPERKPKPTKKPSKVLISGSCQASYYWEGQMTASGEPFDPTKLTAAHKTLSMGSKVRVTNKNNGRSVIVRINDRGPYSGGRCLDLSKAAMIAVGGTSSGIIPVRYEVLR